MGIVREYGYREYADHLTPGRGGESNLLFDRGALAGHAPFHLLNRDDDTADSDGDSQSDQVMGTLALVGVVAASLVVVIAGRSAVRAIKARQRTSRASDEVESEKRVDAEPEVSEQTGGADESDDLLAEVHGLVDDVESRLDDYNDRRRAGGDVRSEGSNIKFSSPMRRRSTRRD